VGPRRPAPIVDEFGQPGRGAAALHVRLDGEAGDLARHHRRANGEGLARGQRLRVERHSSQAVVQNKWTLRVDGVPRLGPQSRNQSH
jgi:hypothetical protein